MRITGAVSATLRDALYDYMTRHAIVSESQAVRELVTKGLGVGVGR